MEFVNIAIIAFGIIVSVLWLVIGWRAMKAHESLAAQATRYNDRLAFENLTDAKRDLVDQKKLYAKFLREHSDAEDLSSKDRHLKYRDWLEDNS